MKVTFNLFKQNEGLNYQYLTIKMDEERRVESDPEDIALVLKTFLREIKPCHRS